ncbi:MAG: hypothetical protein U5N85_01275 [Arcicella sp.]|nr:hypothetical protein [Arcicella sp.]
MVELASKTAEVMAEGVPTVNLFVTTSGLRVMAWAKICEVEA